MTPEPITVNGGISGLFDDVLQGWAVPTGQPGTRLAVEVYIDGQFVALSRADLEQPPGLDDGGDGFHGFAVQLKRPWLEGASHVAVRVANGGDWLPGTVALPRIAPPPRAPLNTSQVWYPGGLTITGWAWDPDDTERAVEVVVMQDGKPIAQGSAALPHPALIHEDNPNHGFRIDMPWALADGQVHTITLQDDKGRPLVGSPITVCTLPEGMQALLRRHWPGKPGDPALALLLRLAQDQDRRAPRTIGFEHYHEWFDVHQVAHALADDTPAAIATGVLLYGDGDDTAEAASRASLAAQRHAPHATVRAEPGRLPQAIHQLLAGGAQAVVPLHVGDTLAPHAIDTLAATLAGEPCLCGSLGVRLQPTRGAEPDGWPTDGTLPPCGPAAWAYADSDTDGPDSRRTAPWLKPAWDIDLFLGADIVTPGAIWGADILRAVFSSDAYPPGGDIHDVAAAIALATIRTGTAVAHVPRVLYHQRAGAATSPELLAPSAPRQAAIQWLAGELAPGATITPNPTHPALLQTHWPLPADADLPRVSLIVPTRDHVKLLRACIEGLLNDTDYPNLEILVVDNDSTCPDTLAYMEDIQARGVTVLRYPHPFNYSAINNHAVAHAAGSVVGLVNNDIEIIEAGWLRAMVAQLLQPGVGIVGAKLLWPNGMVQHAGVVVGINGLAAHIGNSWHSHDAGYMALNHLARRQAAVTAACLLVRRADYQRVNGLDAVQFMVAFNDVDFCLRIGRQQAVVWTPAAKLIHAESASRGKDDQPDKRARALREHQSAYARFAGVEASSRYHAALNNDWANGPYAALATPHIAATLDINEN